MKEDIAKNAINNPTSYLRALGYFVAVAERGGISAAADALNLSPSVLSRSMTLLETRLGVTLFYRTRGAFRLTSNGNSSSFKPIESASGLARSPIVANKTSERATTWRACRKLLT